MRNFIFGFILLGLSYCSQPPKEEKSEILVLKSGSVSPMPDQWIDQDTRHLVKRLVNVKGKNRSFYFHNNPFVPSKGDEGDLMVYYHQDSIIGRQLFVVNLKTGVSRQLTSGDGRKGGEIVVPSLREAFFQQKDSVFAVTVDNGNVRLVYVFPEDFKGRINSVNVDGTMMAGSYALPVKDSIYKANPEKKDYFNLIYEAHVPHWLYTVNLETGELKKIHQEDAWLNHVQFSPTDPDLLMYCHEGPWHKLDRIWTINVKTGEYQKMHERSMPMEIAGHEFFSRDGNKIWYDLQKPKHVDFYLASVDLITGERNTYRMHKDQWSIHFNISPDQKTFAGDGGDSTQVAKAKDGRWIYHFTPQGDTLLSERLVNMSTHNYRPLEPNVHFSPDGKWIIFRSDMDGEIDIYAVKIERES